MTLYLIKVIDTFLVCGLLQPKMNRSLKSQVSPVDFSIPIEMLFVAFADGAQYTAWVSYRHYISRDVLCHNASRTDHCIIPNCNHPAPRSRQHPASSCVRCGWADYTGMLSPAVLAGPGGLRSQGHSSGRSWYAPRCRYGYHPRRSTRSWHRHNRSSERAFRPNWRETAARSSSLRRSLQAFLSKASPVLRIRKGGCGYNHTAAPCKVPAPP